MDAVEQTLRHDPRIAYALGFGSTARGTSTAHSELDVAIGLAPGAALTTLEIGSPTVEVERGSGAPVDLVKPVEELFARRVLERAANRLGSDPK